MTGWQGPLHVKSGGPQMYVLPILGHEPNMSSVADGDLVEPEALLLSVPRFFKAKY